MMEKSVFFKITLSKSLSLISDKCCFYFLEVLYTSKLSFYFADRIFARASERSSNAASNY